MPLDVISEAKAHGGTQGVYRHQSRTTDTPMTFAVFTPPQARDGKVPVLWYLSGLTCTHQNAMDKGEFRRAAAEHGIMIVLSDTSPRAPACPTRRTTGSSARAPASMSTRRRPPMPPTTGCIPTSPTSCRATSRRIFRPT